MNSTPVMVSFSNRKAESSCSLSLLVSRISLALACAALIIARTSPSIFVEVSAEQVREASPPRYWLLMVSSAIMSNSLLMPRRATMARAMRVACSISLEAPLVTVPKITSSAVRPPVRVAILLKASSLVKSTDSSSATCIV